MHTKKVISAFCLYLFFATGVFGIQDGGADLADLIAKIKTIENSETPSLTDARWLVEIISSDNLSLHESVFSDDGKDEILYPPPSHYAIWALSRILENPPFTYNHKNWELHSFLMTGERKRWIEWVKENPLRVRSDSPRRTWSSDLETEINRQYENAEIYENLSIRQAHLQAKGMFRGFTYLEHLYVTGKALPGDLAPIITAPPRNAILDTPIINSPQSNITPADFDDQANTGEGIVSSVPQWFYMFLLLTAMVIVIFLISFTLRKRQ